MSDLYGNGVFSILMLQLKTVLQFFEKGFVFRKICFKVKVLKSIKIFTDRHIKTCRSLKQRPILKIPNTVFLEEIMLIQLA